MFFYALQIYWNLGKKWILIKRNVFHRNYLKVI